METNTLFYIYLADTNVQKLFEVEKKETRISTKFLQAKILQRFVNKKNNQGAGR